MTDGTTPDRYPVVVIGSGPGGLQVSHELARLRVRHVVLSSDEGPGGTFRRWPHFQRLITWTKPHTGLDRSTRFYERYDWNSLVTDDPSLRALVASAMDGTSYFPARAEMLAGLSGFATRARLPLRHSCRWTATRRDDDGYVVTTTDGEYRTRNLVVATGMTRPYRAPIPGLERLPHYAEVKPLAAYRDRRVLIIGKRNSAFELADGLLPHARQIVLSSPRPASFALETHTPAGVRARYVQPLEDHILRGGVLVLDASVERVEQDGAVLRAHLRPSQGGDALAFDFDEVIAATGFESEINDLAAIGLRTHGHLQVPAQTAFWESVTLPGVFFAGTLSQGARGLRKHGIPSASASVHGFRYNARILARFIATDRLGVAVPRRVIRREELVPHLLSELTRAPELWLQRSYLARVVSLDGGEAMDDGILPLHHFVDAGPRDGIAVAIEQDARGETYPAVYVRRSGDLSEHVLSGSTLLDFETAAHERELAALIPRP